MKPTIVTLTGPTCAGKSTLESMLKERGFAVLKSVTTRSPRRGEVNGLNYDFVSVDVFKSMIANNELIEHVEFDGNLYGVSANEVIAATDQGKPIVIVVEPEGKKQIEKYAVDHDWNIITVFVDNPREVIAKRFIERYSADLIKSPRSSSEVMDRYSKRLCSMMSTEMGWRADAYSGSGKYDVLVASFDGINSNAAVYNICSMVGISSLNKKVA